MFNRVPALVGLQIVDRLSEFYFWGDRKALARQKASDIKGLEAFGGACKRIKRGRTSRGRGGWCGGGAVLRAAVAGWLGVVDEPVGRRVWAG